jgi:hypothetical protein
MERSDRGLVEVPSQHLPRGTEENNKNLRIACVVAELPTEHLFTFQRVITNVKPLKEPQFFNGSFLRIETSNPFLIK